MKCKADRNMAVMADRGAGLTYKAIGQRHGISTQRVRSIVLATQARLLKEADLPRHEAAERAQEVARVEAVIARHRLADRRIDDVLTSVRTFNCLSSAGLTDWAAVARKTDDELLSIRALGWKSLCEIRSILARLTGGEM